MLYSDQVIAANRRIDTHLLRLLAKRSPRIGYVPSMPDPRRGFFRDRQAYYAQCGIADLGYFEPDECGATWEKAELLSCDAIHLTGGNTRLYLGRLRRAGLIEILRRYARDGGVLIGASAGAILLTPDIAVDALFQGRPPAHDAAGAALDLVPFEFFPHLDKDPGYLPALIAYSRTNADRPILACPDGDGIVVEGSTVTPVGAPVLVQCGRSSACRAPITLP